jgi:hypothetical protein
MILVNLGRTTWNLFKIWPASEEVQFVWQADFTNIAAYLDEAQETAPTAIGGWTPDTMDPPTMALLLMREDLTLRYFDPTQSLIIPAAPGEDGRLIWPASLPPTAEIEQKLSAWGLPTSANELNESFIITRYTDFSLPPAQHSAETTFSDEITFLGYDLLEPTALLTPGRHRLLTYWRVERPTPGPRRFFLHLIDEAGQPIAQQDTLGAPAEYWQIGDTIIQLHILDVPALDRQATLLLGIYNPANNQRLISGELDAIRLTNP